MLSSLHTGDIGLGRVAAHPRCGLRKSPLGTKSIACNGVRAFGLAGGPDMALSSQPGGATDLVEQPAYGFQNEFPSSESGLDGWEVHLALFVAQIKVRIVSDGTFVVKGPNCSPLGVCRTNLLFQVVRVCGKG